jgi:hypothetical protein
MLREACLLAGAFILHFRERRLVDGLDASYQLSYNRCGDTSKLSFSASVGRLVQTSAPQKQHCESTSRRCPSKFLGRLIKSFFYVFYQNRPYPLQEKRRTQIYIVSGRTLSNFRNFDVLFDYP